MRRSLPSRLPPSVLLPFRPTTLPRAAAAALPTSYVTLRTPSRPFSSTRPRREQEAPRSPFRVFVETLKMEIEKNRELQENVKQLQGDVGKMQDSESMKKAKDMYERARVSSFVFEGILVFLLPALSTLGGKGPGESLRVV